MTIINVSLEKVHSKTNIVRKKEENKGVGEGLVPSRKKDKAIPYLKKEENSKERNKSVGEGLAPSRDKEFIPPPPSISKEAFVKLREHYEDKILKRIHAMKYYPIQARRMNQEGVVKVEFTLKRDGTLKGDVALIKGCRYEALNNAAVKTIVRANPYPAFSHVIKKDEMTFVIEVDFRLKAW